MSRASMMSAVAVKLAAARRTATVLRVALPSEGEGSPPACWFGFFLKCGKVQLLEWKMRSSLPEQRAISLRRARRARRARPGAIIQGQGARTL